MISKTIEHITRKISFSADESRTWTEDDEKLVTAYLQLHNREQSLKIQGDDLVKKFTGINKQTEKLRAILNVVKKLITAASELADKFNPIIPKKQEIVKQITDETEKISNRIQKYHRLMEKLSVEIDVHSKINSRFLDDLENMELWEAYKEVMHIHFNNYEINSIDIVSFSNEDELFRGFASVWDDKNKYAFDYSDKAIENYNRLILETEIQYGIWKEYLKRFELIRLINENTASQILSSAN